MSKGLEACVLIIIAAMLMGLIGIGIYPNVQAQGTARPYEVYKIPRGCLYIVGTRQTAIAVAFVPDGPNEPCH